MVGGGKQSKERQTGSKYVRGQTAVLNRVVRADLTEKVTSE